MIYMTARYWCIALADAPCGYPGAGRQSRHAIHPHSSWHHALGKVEGMELEHNYPHLRHRCPCHVSDPNIYVDNLCFWSIVSEGISLNKWDDLDEHLA